ncbi:MAG: hypothetical protein KGJ59_11555 [Bacteroidota bacterium]|nr:hypothetical protein [Bacteroidota bacterium]
MSSKQVEYYETMAGVFELHRLLVSTPDDGISGKLAKRLRESFSTVLPHVERQLASEGDTAEHFDEESLTAEVLRTERHYLSREIRKIIVFSKEMGESFWLNGAQLRYIIGSLRIVMARLCRYFEIESGGFSAVERSQLHTASRRTI